MDFLCRTLPHLNYQVNDIRPGADPVNERIRSQLVAKHGQDFKSKVFVSIFADLVCNHAVHWVIRLSLYQKQNFGYHWNSDAH